MIMSQRIALVTGASRGIGRASALSLAAAGHHVVLAARQMTKLEEAAAEIREKGGVATVISLDLADAENIRESLKTLLADVGHVDILVNNAGITKDMLAMRMKAEDWDEVLRVNLTGAFLVTQAVLQSMIRERWGRIINISSVVGQMGNAGQANYAASKAGVIGLTKTLAQELAARNITVNAVAPGFIETDMTAVLSETVKERLLSLIPAKRFGSAEDVANLVTFLASDAAGYITGQVVAVNGGMYM
ncbi:MAG: 3-oxoacyl-[acyl-carrier-protein] reductase [Bryobacterales bacterium]|nr:3-oxoacyl-[acyl-carrier-protein] reductase [Bryobacterales bacterium]